MGVLREKAKGPVSNQRPGLKQLNNRRMRYDAGDQDISRMQTTDGHSQSNKITREIGEHVQWGPPLESAQPYTQGA